MQIDNQHLKQTQTDFIRESRIKALGALVCSPSSTRLWRIVCMAEQRRLIRDRSSHQLARMEADLLVLIRLSEARQP